MKNYFYYLLFYDQLLISLQHLPGIQKTFKFLVGQLLTNKDPLTLEAINELWSDLIKRFNVTLPKTEVEVNSEDANSGKYIQSIWHSPFDENKDWKKMYIEWTSIN